MIIDGNKTAEKILQEIKKEIKEKQLKLKLAVVLVGDNEVSKIYVEKKREAALRVGIDFELFCFSKDISQNDLEEEVKKISQKKDIQGIVVQLPLPSQINTDKILNCIPPDKDVEGFVSDINSPVAEAVDEFFKEYKISLENKNILVIGKGRLVGGPVSRWLESKRLNFNIIDKLVEDITLFTKKADVIITGTGVPNLIKEDMVKQGVIIIDAGTYKEDGETIGDVDFKNVCNKAQCITPCIGGIGPVTIACLFRNLVRLSKSHPKKY